MAWIKTRIAKPKEYIEKLAISSDGQMLLCASGQDIAYLWGINEPKLIAKTPKKLGPIWAIAISSDGKYAALAGKQLWLWDIEHLKTIALRPLDNLEAHALCFVPNSQVLAIGGNNRITLLDISQNQEISLPNSKGFNPMGYYFSGSFSARKYY